MTLARNETRIERNETRLERNETRLARNETRGGNLHLGGTVHVYNTERLNELSQELDNLYILYAGKKVKTRCRDMYNVHKRVIKIDIFQGVSLITVCIK